MIKQILLDYVVTFGWAIVGSISIGLGIIITLWMFDKFTGEVSEWKEIKENNISVAIVLASLIIACAWVVSSIIRP
ncbi:DUF350 domain-containing protein [Nitratiruptor sp. YY09-18]|uniref:DUF350 domain-containing protein n=1 Tax=Nitratiruptor sp. YY09-18 TaxID=2724901 RepID=UPI0019156C15|nr:DUF350 domain-containing protein [Nitratiruptor sp. YY09-18]BCD67493.1 hypothetical protein NitYY0918_C0386 [Nitratiruptor sp. YY09-18]